MVSDGFSNCLTVDAGIRRDRQLAPTHLKPHAADRAQRLDQSAAWAIGGPQSAGLSFDTNGQQSTSTTEEGPLGRDDP